MARAKLDPEVLAHLEWIGFVRPTGLVVSAPALVRAGVILDRRDAEGQRLLRACVEERRFDAKEGPVPWVPEFRTFAQSVLGWNFSPTGYAGTTENAIPTELQVPLPDYGETLQPNFAVRELEPDEGTSPWQLVVRVLEPGQDFDRVVRGDGGLEASAHGRMERLLRQTGVPAGLLFNGRALRLLSAPRGESSGWLDFQVADMVQTAGRPISTALRLLLGQARLLALPRPQRLAALLESSRKFQNEVSERLAEQVLHALYELLRGFQAAHDASKGDLLRKALAEHPDEVYRALLTVLLRLVFLLYAEERDMLPEDDTFLRFYSLAGLYERLREDAALFPDTMDQRYGAWAQLLVLFRMIHDGAESGSTRLPKRHGVLFDPNRFPFLEGRQPGKERGNRERIEAPLVHDGTIYRALEKLLVLDGERISYRALDVEQIGSVYETMMGFRLETATGLSVAIRSQRKRGAPSVVNLETLLAEAATRRDKWLQKCADRKLTDRIKRAVAAAGTVEDLHAALLPVIDTAATGDLVPKGAMVLQPSEERRRSGSHYTPRSLTEPIVRRTLEPVMAGLRGDSDRPPRPAQILDLKICDPAMGSGAFLVETCRHLGDALQEAWHAHGEVPAVPSDEDEVVFARRLIAQRCLYGVDRNPVAVDLAKVSLWLATLAKDHPFTFLDHSLRCGDSLVGLTREQIVGFHWAPTGQVEFVRPLVDERLRRAVEFRQRIHESGEGTTEGELRRLLSEADLALEDVRRIGDRVVAAFFGGGSAQEREGLRRSFAEDARRRLANREGLVGDKGLATFHWRIEFPEVFDGGGFDAVVGNPPFAGKNTLIAGNPDGYLDWLKEIHAESHGNADLVAHFFRRAFFVLRDGGCFGLIATKTIRQGDTRTTGLRWICTNGGTIYAATRRLKWPGAAAVVVSLVHVCKGPIRGEPNLDGRAVPTITAFLFHAGGHEKPHLMTWNAGRSFEGVKVYGQGFTFADDDADGLATPIEEMRRLIAGNPRNAERVFPYLGGQEVNDSPGHRHRRYVIDFGEMTESDARQWPELFSIVEQRVRPSRQEDNREQYRRLWWQFGEKRVGLRRAIAGKKRVLVCCRHQPHWALAMLSTGPVFSDALNVIALESFAAFAVLQSRPHEIWARFFGSTMKDDLRYTPSECFETFPFPDGFETNSVLEQAGQAYHEYRAALMVGNGQGLTKTYNRFHAPDENSEEFVELRRLHDVMDRAVLDAYDWHDVGTTSKSVPDYEDSEDGSGPCHYRWPDDVHDDVLLRLLLLNRERARVEGLAGAAAGTRRRSRRGRQRPTPDMPLLEEERGP